MTKQKSRKKVSTIDVVPRSPKYKKKPPPKPEYDREYVNQRIKDLQNLHSHHKNYGIDHPKTKEAEDFVSHIRHRRSMEKRQFQEIQEMRMQEAERARELREEEKRYEKEEQRMRKMEEY